MTKINYLAIVIASFLIVALGLGATELRQSTSVTVKLGPFTDITDGTTRRADLTILKGSIWLSKAGGAMAVKNEATAATYDGLGVYFCPLDATDTGTPGPLRIDVNDINAVPVWAEFMVLDLNAYDAKYASLPPDVNTLQIQSALTAYGAPTQITIAASDANTQRAIAASDANTQRAIAASDANTTAKFATNRTQRDANDAALGALAFNPATTKVDLAPQAFDDVNISDPAGDPNSWNARDWWIYATKIRWSNETILNRTLKNFTVKSSTGNPLIIQEVSASDNNETIGRVHSP